jgi:D-alanyl-D-alanine carboxypeptidase
MWIMRESPFAYLAFGRQSVISHQSSLMHTITREHSVTFTLAQLWLSLALGIASPSVIAQDSCLASAIQRAQPPAQLQGEIVISTLTATGERDTQIVRNPDASRSKLVGNEGFRLASVTKTYVAATALRLWERGKLDLRAPIAGFLPEDWNNLLLRDGYHPDRILVRHLLSHTGGLADHARTAQFIDTIKNRPQTEWSRLKVIESLVEWTEPVGAPGEKYSYSDSGYVLLGAIIERVTGQNLPSVVRAELKLDMLAPNAYWERFEPARGAARAHQMFQGIDTYDWNPSMDLFGGGGLVAPAPDMAAFFDALLRGKLFERPETLGLMRSRDELPQDSPYGLGLITYDFEGATGFGHSGFWGISVVHEPKSQRTVAGAVTERTDFPKLEQVVSEYVRRAAASVGASPAVRCEAGP